MSIACSYTTGCTNPAACNYIEDAEVDDGNCHYWDACGECLPPGDTTCDIDCNGVGNGTAYVNPCGDCVNPDTDNCVQGCDDFWTQDGNQAIPDECGNCSNDFANLCSPTGAPGETFTDGCHQCCGGTYVCDPSACGDEVLDSCGVCEGDGSTCDAFISITQFKFTPYPNTNNVWFFEHVVDFYGNILGFHDVYANCYTPPDSQVDCVTSDIMDIQKMRMEFQINSGGAGFNYADGDVEGSDMDIQGELCVYINRNVIVDGVESGCHDIFGHEDDPKVINLDYRADDENGSGLLSMEYAPPAGSPGSDPDHVFFFDGGVQIPMPGGNYTFDDFKNVEFDVIYQVKMYLKNVNVIGYEDDYANINITDINNPLTAIQQEGTSFNFHHQPMFPCSGLPGDSGAASTGEVTCEDYTIAAYFYFIQNCVDWQNNPDAPPNCCNLASLSLPYSELTQDDLNILLNVILEGQGCV
tara:strand:- start:8129 stop:9535 length:1407 start_codon:yes stop_codon:yes gene_type:complete